MPKKNLKRWQSLSLPVKGTNTGFSWLHTLNMNLQFNLVLKSNCFFYMFLSRLICLVCMLPLLAWSARVCTGLKAWDKVCRGGKGVLVQSPAWRPEAQHFTDHNAPVSVSRRQQHMTRFGADFNKRDLVIVQLLVLFFIIIILSFASY